MRISIDKFYDIYAPDVTVPSKGDKKQKNAQNKKFIQELLETNITNGLVFGTEETGKVFVAD